MATIGIIDDDGNRTERTVISRTANFTASAALQDAGDGGGGGQTDESFGPFEPSLVQRVKFDHKGQMSSITTECGETENRREADNKPGITVEGIITEDEISPMKSLKEREEITFVSDIYEGEVIIDRLSIVQSPDLLYYSPNGEEKQMAFEFQMQVEQPE